MDRRVPAGAGPDGHHRPRADQPDRHQGRALQPLPRRGFSCRRANGRCATSTAATARPWAASWSAAIMPLEAGRHHPHRPIATGLRPRSVQGVSRFECPDAICGADRLERRDDLRRAASTTATCSPAHEPTTITHRRGQTKFLEPGDEEDDGDLQSRPRRRQALPAGLRAGQAPDIDVDGRAGPGRPVRRQRRSTPAALLLLAADRGTASRAAPIWRSSPRAPTPSCPIIASRPFWPPPCCARARPCWPATSWATARWAAATARARSTPPA